MTFSHYLQADEASPLYEAGVCQWLDITTGPSVFSSVLITSNVLITSTRGEHSLNTIAPSSPKKRTIKYSANMIMVLAFKKLPCFHWYKLYQLLWHSR